MFINYKQGSVYSMYLISIYFDELCDKKIRHLMNLVAKNTGNSTLLDDNVPPHITISAFETQDENAAILCLKKCSETLSADELQWVSVSTFFPYVIYLSPVLNEYLFDMSKLIYDNFSSLENVSINKYYQPFQWQPHTTVGRKLTEDEMRIAFETLQKHFVPFSGNVTKIGLAKTNPHKDIAIYELK